MNTSPNLSNRQEIRDEIKSLAPDLEKNLSEPSNVQIPGSYFPQLQERIRHRIFQEEPSKNRNKSFLLSSVWVRSIAASFVLVILAGTVWWWTNKPPSFSDSFSKLSLEEMETYLDDRIHLMDEGLLLDYSLITASESYFIDENTILEYLNEDPPSLEDISGDDLF